MSSSRARYPVAARNLLVMLVVAAVLAGCAGCAASGTRTPKRSTPTVDPPTSSTSTSTTSTTILPRDAKKPPVPGSGAYFGTWRGPGPQRPADVQTRLAQAEQQIGRKYAIDHRYYDWGSVLPSSYEQWTSSQGRIPLVNLCACRFNDRSVVPWSEIASGAHDAYLAAMADRFAFFAAPVFLIFDGEPEAKVGPSQKAADFRAAWRHIVQTFRAHKADNVAFMWDTTAYSFTAESGDAAKVKSLYPGDDVVDWIAADPYNFNHDGVWRSLSFELDTWYRWARAEHPGKPLALAEWGSKEDPNDSQHKAEWLRDALDQLENRYRQIKAVVYFDEEKHEDNTVNDWRIDTSTPTLRAFAGIARSRWFDISVRRGG